MTAFKITAAEAVIFAIINTPDLDPDFRTQWVNEVTPDNCTKVHPLEIIVEPSNPHESSASDYLFRVVTRMKELHTNIINNIDDVKSQKELVVARELLIILRHGVSGDKSELSLQERLSLCDDIINKHKEAFPELSNIRIRNENIDPPTKPPRARL